MALYAIADLHLPIGVNKPMDIFGCAWHNYVERLETNWKNTISDDDTVVLAGDFSWATYIRDAYKDFDFINRLPGKKYLVKGNHDYWWTTMNKMRGFVAENGFDTINFLQNNCFMYNSTAVCATRGWRHPGCDAFTAEDRKIFNREVIRLRLALDAALKQSPSDIIVFTHYPPTDSMGCRNDFTEVLSDFGVSKCVYGHLHSASHKKAVQGIFGGVEYILVSADYVEFMPVKILD